MSFTKPLVVDIHKKAQHGDTFLNSEKFSYTWTIHNFSYTTFRSDGSNLKSPTFQTLHKGNNISWYLRLSNERNLSDKRMYLLACGKVSQDCKISAKSEFSVINENIEESIKYDVTQIGMYPSGHQFFVSSYSNYIPSRQDLMMTNSGFCPNDKLTVVFEITFLTDELISTSNSCNINQQVPECELVDDIGAFFGNKNFSDIKLTVNGKDFHAHKIMLAARSSVFAAMFEHEMTENINNTVNITDISYNIFEEVLRYIYTGKISSLSDETAIELLVAADKYELNRLKIICEVFIGKNLTKDNVTDILIVADAHRSTLLKTQALEFISAHMKDVMNTNGYKSMRKSHPDLIGDCCNALAEKLEQIGIK